MQPMNVFSPDIVHFLPLGSLTEFQLWLDARIQLLRKTLFELSCEVYRCITTFEKEKCYARNEGDSNVCITRLV